VTGTRGRTIEERLLEKVVKNANGCWIWTGCKGGHGYGWLRIGPRSFPAHRVAYELFVGPIPEGLTLDHTCHGADETCPGGAACEHRACINPAHLEAVTRAENVMRGMGFAPANAAKTHCPAGHEYTPANTYRNAKGHRHCRACALTARRARYVPKAERAVA
jgi:hypothetical protein